MRIALILCPAWIAENPPNNTALLKSSLKNNNHQVKCFDLNIRFYNYIKDISTENLTKKSTINIEAWRNTNISVWENKKTIKELFANHKNEIDSYLNDVLNYSPSLIGFTAYSVSVHFSVEMAELLKKRNPKIKIVFGGPECFPHYRGKTLFKYSSSIDYICYGEGERALSNLAEMLENKKQFDNITGFYHRLEDGNFIEGSPISNIEDIDTIPYADYSDFNFQDYTTKTIAINTSRGCINRCSFCNESPFWKKFRTRSVHNVFKEIVELINQYPSIEELWFVDSLINGDIYFLESLCDLLIKNKIAIKWTASAYIKENLSLELFNKMKLSGCDSLLFGLESGNDKVLKEMNKGYSIKTAKKVLLNSVKANINTYTNIIIGHPGENINTYLKTVRFLLFFLNPNKIRNTTFNVCYVLNGSTLKQKTDDFKINFGFVDSWYSKDYKNNKEIRDYWLKSIEGLPYFNHYQKETNSILRLLKNNILTSFFIYIFYFEIILRVKSYFLIWNFRKRHHQFYTIYRDESFVFQKESSLSKLQQWKLHYLLKNKIQKNKQNDDYIHYSKVLLKILKHFNNDEIELVLNFMFPLSTNQIINLFGKIRDEDIPIIVSIIKSQINLKD